MNEMKLANMTMVPPGGYPFKHPETGQNFRSGTYSLLLGQVRDYCSANGYPPISEESIQQYICEQLGPETARRFCSGDGVSVSGVDLNWRDIWAGTKVMASFIAGGRQTVDRAEAERRAQICFLCSRNAQYAKPCGGDCPELADLVSAIVGGEGTSRDLDLHACSVCKCSNKAQVWVPIEHLKHGVPDEMMPLFTPTCWKKQGIEELNATNA
jgi:hypothetical protein